MSKINLLEDSPKKLFLKYLIPSTSATLVTSIYLLADSVIIGKGISPDGIAALNIILPLFSFYFGLGTLFGVGGGVLMSVAQGSGNKDEGRRIFTLSLLLAAVVSVVSWLATNMLFTPLLYMLGATDDSYALIAEYAAYTAMFSPVFTFSTFLQVFIVNDKGPKTAMAAVISGGISNIILDLIFIYPLNMGMAGGSIATVIGSAITVLVLSTHFLKKEHSLRPLLNGFLSLRTALKIFKCGIASFILDMANGVTIFIFNIRILHYIGKTGIVVYSVISNSSLIAISLFNGVSRAAQPIISTNYGANKPARVAELLKTACTAAFIIGCLAFGIGLAIPETIIDIFIIADAEILALGRYAIRLYFSAFIFTGVNLLLSTYFQSVTLPNCALIVSLLRGIILNVSLVYIIPQIFGVNSIWLVVAISEATAFVIALLLYKKTSSSTSFSQA